MKFVFKSLIIISLLGVVCGFEIPSYEGYVTDKVGVFSETQKADLTSKIEEIEKATSIEIAILVVPTVDDDINLAAVDVGNKRGVGKKGQDNGLMILIAVDDRKWSIQVGYGLEGTLPDLATKQIGDARFPPNFRNSDYYQGIVEMLDDVLGYIKQDPTILANYSSKTSTSSGFSDNKDYMEFIFLFFIIAISIFGRRLTIPSIKSKRQRKMRKYGRWMYGGIGFLLALLIMSVIPFILAAFVSYFFLLIGILMAMYGKTGSGRGGIRFGGTGGGFGGGGSSFGGFGGGSFGGGGSSGSR